MRVAGVRKEHSAHNRWAGIAYRTSIGFYPVHTGVVSNRIEFPEDFAGLRRIGKQLAVHGSWKHNSRDRGDCRRVGWFAGFSFSARRVRSVPNRVSIAKLERRHPTTRIGTRLIKEAVGHVNAFAIHCESPQNTASAASSSGLLLPNQFPSLIRIEGPNHS